MKILPVIAAAALLLAACTTTPSAGSPAPEASSPVPAGVPTPTRTIEHQGVTPEDPYPGDFRVRYGQEELVIGPVTYCHKDGEEAVCVDGWDHDPPTVGSPEEIFVFVPVEGYTELTVSQMVDDVECVGAVDARAEPLGQGWWRVTPQGPASNYRVSVFASGAGGGDMIADILWQTPGGDLPEVEAMIAVVVDHDGPDSYGVELYLNNLEASPAEAQATITVTAAGGESLTFEATDLHTGCSPIGAAWWLGPAEKGTEAAALGEFPFTIEVDLRLDGTHHTATAVYPDDADPGDDPFLRLHFTPPLG